jgi:hypothetical protein
VARQLAEIRREIAVDLVSVFERKEGEQREEHGGFIGRALMAVTARGVSGGGSNGRPAVSSGGVKPEVEEDPDEWVPSVSEKKKK